MGSITGWLLQNERWPEKSLAKMFQDDLGIEVDPQALRFFICSRWSRVNVLAHAIHDAGEATTSRTSTSGHSAPPSEAEALMLAQG